MSGIARFALLMALAAGPLCPGIRAQCSACRDNTAGSAPQMRRGLRKAIPVLGVPAALLFTGILILAARGTRD